MAGRGAPLDIAVVGCGPAGMAAGLLLARAGHRLTLFERFDAPKAVGAGLLLQPTGLAVLSRLGLLPRVLAAGARIDRLVGDSMPSGRRILSVAYADLAPGLHGLGIHRAALFDALNGAMAETAIDLSPSSTIVAAEAAADGRPVLVHKSGRRSGPFDLAVDASGSQSALRRSEPGPRPFAYGALWATLPLAAFDFDRATLAQRYRAAARMAGVMPVGTMPGADGPHAVFFWSLRRDDLDSWRNAGLSAWKAEVAALWPEAGRFVEGLDRADALAPAFYAHYTARRPAGVRIVQIGDAAHSTSPQLGQGANMALLDAFALCEELSAHARPDEALAGFVRRRRRHIRFYQAASAWMTPLFQSDSRVAALARDLALPAMRRVPWLRRETARALAGLKTGLFSSLDPADPLAPGNP